jgi:hypothetical protein
MVLTARERGLTYNFIPHKDTKEIAKAQRNLTTEPQRAQRKHRVAIGNRRYKVTDTMDLTAWERRLIYNLKI